MRIKSISRWILAILLISMPLQANSGYFYYVANETGYFIHVSADEEDYLFIAPGTELEFKGDDEIRVHVFYSPGQDVTGEASRTLLGDEDKYGTDCDCDDNGVFVGDNNWTVYAEDLN